METMRPVRKLWRASVAAMIHNWGSRERTLHLLGLRCRDLKDQAIERLHTPLMKSSGGALRPRKNYPLVNPGAHLD